MIRKLREGLTSRIQFHLYNTGNRVTSFKAFVDKCMGTEAAAAHQDVDRARTVYRLREQDFPFPAISPRDRERKRNEGPENLRWTSQILFFFFFFFAWELAFSSRCWFSFCIYTRFGEKEKQKKQKKFKLPKNSLLFRSSDLPRCSLSPQRQPRQLPPPGNRIFMFLSWLCIEKPKNSKKKCFWLYVDPLSPLRGPNTSLWLSSCSTREIQSWPIELPITSLKWAVFPITLLHWQAPPRQRPLKPN